MVEREGKLVSWMEAGLLVQGTLSLCGQQGQIAIALLGADIQVVLQTEEIAQGLVKIQTE